ncbi:MAG: nuclear transport factor 2 family protein [Gammaproteobacteria bacterium]|jgi:3-phenylpropionate/cinnamic acid dioxygenase small subunit
MSTDAAARLDISDVLNRYAWAYDTHDPEAIGECFTDDGEFIIELDGHEGWGPYRGRAAIMSWLASVMDAQTDQRRHCVTNVVMRELGPASARVDSYLVLTAVEDGQLRVVCTGTYHDDLVREGDGWRIARKLLRLDNPF